jgi:hypothetical protein
LIAASFFHLNLIETKIPPSLGEFLCWSSGQVSNLEDFTVIGGYENEMQKFTIISPR